LYLFLEVAGKSSSRFVSRVLLPAQLTLQRVRRFVSELELEHCMLGFIKSQKDMPRWGQLGCSGFIILDGQKNVVSKSTTAFLKMQKLAFSHVEALLDSLLAGTPIPSVCPGQSVVLGVSEPNKKGEKSVKGVVLDVVDPLDGQCSVFLFGSGSGGGSMMRVAPAKMRLLPEDLQISAQQLRYVEQAQKLANAAAMERQKGQPGAALIRGLKEDSKKDRKREAECEVQTADAADGKRQVVEVHVASVMNAELDQQHEECAAALQALANERTASALEVALGAIQQHFKFEQQLLDKHIYEHVATADGMGGGFNADQNMRTSHYGDHARIICTMEEHLVKIRAIQPENTCSKVGGCALPGGQRLALSSITSLISDFENHADR